VSIRVAHIGSRGIPGYRGGVERVLEAIAPRMARDGYEVTVYRAPWSPYREPTYRGVNLVRVPGVRCKYLDTIVRSVLAAFRELFTQSEIVHIHGSGSAFMALPLRLARKKVVVTVHGLDWQRQKWNALGRFVLRWGEWAAVAFPHRTVVVGEALKRHLESRYHKEVHFIPNGIELREERPADRIEALGLAQRKFVLFLARLVPEKQCHLLVEAFRRLRLEDPEMKLAIAGPSWHSKDYVASLKADIGEDPAIRFLGEVEEDVLEELYSNCYLYVLPSEVEGMSLSLLEALSFGCCVLVSDIPPNRDLVKEAGEHFQTGRVEDLAKKMEGLIRDADRATALRIAAKEWASNAFYWDCIVLQWEALYDDLASR